MKPFDIIPGVFVEEVSFRRFNIARLKAGIPVFVGRTERAVRDDEDRRWRPTRVPSQAAFRAVFGAGWQKGKRKLFLHEAVDLFFANGGESCWVLSVGGPRDPFDLETLAQALERLGSCDEPDLLLLPEAVLFGSEAYLIYRDALMHCRRHGRRFLLIDLPERRPGDRRFGWREGVAEFRALFAAPPELAKFGAAYTPWLRLRRGAVVPPCGAVAGAIVATERKRGIWTAPANVSLAGISGTSKKLDHGLVSSLTVDPIAGYSINAIRPFSGRGVLVWGARTLAGNDNEARYVPIQRTRTWIQASVERGLEWVVFEPNDESLWAEVRAAVNSFFEGLWREGALVGLTPRDAWFIQVGLGRTMTANDIQQGRLRVLMGFSPLKPAEFVLVRLDFSMEPVRRASRHRRGSVANRGL